jgi:hypothetical protein
MRKIKEVLRLRGQGLSDREISRGLKTGRTTVRWYRGRADEAGLTWPLPPELTEGDLEARLFPPVPSAGTPRPLPDWKPVHRELRRPGMTHPLPYHLLPGPSSRLGRQPGSTLNPSSRAARPRRSSRVTISRLRAGPAQMIAAAS